MQVYALFCLGAGHIWDMWPMDDSLEKYASDTGMARIQTIPAFQYNNHCATGAQCKGPL